MPLKTSIQLVCEVEIVSFDPPKKNKQHHNQIPYILINPGVLNCRTEFPKKEYIQFKTERVSITIKFRIFELAYLHANFHLKQRILVFWTKYNQLVFAPKG